MALVPIENQPGLFRDSDTGELVNIRDLSEEPERPQLSWFTQWRFDCLQLLARLFLGTSGLLLSLGAACAKAAGRLQIAGDKRRKSENDPEVPE